MDDAIFDAHLDLAMNAQRGRDITQRASEQPIVGNEIATVGLPDLRAGNVRKICATIFCQPDSPEHPGYRDAESAYVMASAQLAIYRELFPEDLQALLLIEGAECIRSPEDLATFYTAGVRIIGLAWQDTRYAGGTARPGPLTDAGREMVAAIDSLPLVYDASHLAEESFWELIKIAERPVIASHSNCRAIVGHDPSERHLSDDMIRAIIERDGVVGINFYDRFLLPHDTYGNRRATLGDVVAHIRRVCDLANDTTHVGIGTDMDGGLGREQIPVEISTSADLPRLAGALRDAGFSDADVRKIMFDNWNDRFNRWLSA